MKRVFPKSSDVIHLFAQQTQTDARCANVFFKPSSYDREWGDEIYSYGHHYLLGKFIADSVIIIDDTGYSVTTSKHISEIRYATSQYTQFFVTEIDINLVLRDVKSNLEKLSRARKPELYINAINRAFNQLNKWRIFMSSNRAIKSKYKVRANDSKFKAIKKIVESLKVDSVEAIEKLKKFEANKKKREAAKERKRLKIALEKFYGYETNYARIGSEDFVRLSQDGESIETTQGISVSVKEAKVLYKMILAGKDIKGHNIDGYTVTGINGTLKIGCHNINKESMHNIGKLIC